MADKGYPTPMGIPAKKPQTMKAGKPEVKKLFNGSIPSATSIPSIRPTSKRNLMVWPGWKGGK